MSRAFAGIAAAFSIVMLAVQFFIADEIKVPVAALWSLVLVLSVYVLFFKKPKGDQGGS